MRIFTSVIMFILFLSLLITTPGKATPLAISTVYIEPTGYEDPLTHEWRGSYWVITALADTKESFLFYKFNETQVNLYGQNKIGEKTIVPQATIKITITPKKPYWEVPLKTNRYMVYPKTYGTYFNYWNFMHKVFGPDKLEDIFVPQLYVDTLEFDSDAAWTLHTPFDVTIEKIGDKKFSKTVSIDTIGGTKIVTVENPYDNSEKLMVTNLGKIITGYGQPSISSILIIGDTAFEKSNDLLKAIDYKRAIDYVTHTRLTQENYAFYWFGGGRYKSENRYDVLFWPDDCSPAHYCKKELNYYSLVEEEDFPGSYRQDGPNPWDQRAIPIAADIFNDNPSTIPHGLSLVNYLIYKAKFNPLGLDLWKEGWDITSDNKLRIYMPMAAASSLITIKISTELADSVVYQPIVANGKVEQAFWNSTKTTNTVILDKDMAVLKIRQYAAQPSKITVTPSISQNVPISVSPQMDSAIVNPGAVHTFQFEIKNLGTQANQSSTITFTITNDLGAVTDTITLNFELITTQNITQNPQNPPEDSTTEGDPLWIWLVAVISITIVTATIYSIYIYRPSKDEKKQTRTSDK